MKEQESLIEEKIEQINIKEKKWEEEEERQRREELAYKEKLNYSMESWCIKGTTKLEETIEMLQSKKI